MEEPELLDAGQIPTFPLRDGRNLVFGGPLLYQGFPFLFDLDPFWLELRVSRQAVRYSAAEPISISTDGPIESDTKDVGVRPL